MCCDRKALEELALTLANQSTREPRPTTTDELKELLRTSSSASANHVMGCKPCHEELSRVRMIVEATSTVEEPSVERWHPRDSAIIEHLAGHLPEGRSEQLESHLLRCEPCAGRVEPLRARLEAMERLSSQAEVIPVHLADRRSRPPAASRRSKRRYELWLDGAQGLESRLAADSGISKDPTFPGGLDVYDDGVVLVRVSEVFASPDAPSFESGLAVSVRLTPEYESGPTELGQVKLRGPGGTSVMAERLVRNEPRLQVLLIPVKGTGSYSLTVDSPPIHLEFDVYRSSNQGR